MIDTVPIRFIDETISVVFKKPPGREKKPPCPDAFEWQGESYEIAVCLSEWIDFSRRGRMVHNMRDNHLKSAIKQGSWGVGRFFFRVKVKQGQIFDLYYDRSVKNVNDRKGHWYLLAERRNAGNK